VRFVDLVESNGGSGTAGETESVRDSQSGHQISSADSNELPSSAAAASSNSVGSGEATSGEPANSKSYFSPLHPFGIKYYFNLTEAIDDCPEYLVHMPTLENLCSQFGLEVVSDMSLHNFLYAHIDQHHSLLRRMGIIDPQQPAGTSLTQDEWDALNVYKAVVFRKRTPAEFTSSMCRPPMYYTAPPAHFTHPTFPPARRVNHSDIQQLRQEVDSVQTRMAAQKQAWIVQRERQQTGQQQHQQR